MDKAEYKIKLEEINHLVEQQDYESALEIVDTIDWRRVKSVKTLVTVADIYEANGQYANAKTVLKLALDKATIGKSILYRLSEISIKTRDFDDAVGYYTEFMSVAPKDNSKYILKYKIYRGRKSSIEEQIAILEEYKEHEYTERWSYELARLYQRAGMIDKCVEECDDLILWFSDGSYVLKAMEMKQKYAPLTPAQAETLREIENRKRQRTEEVLQAAPLKEEDMDKLVENTASIEMNLKKMDDAGALLAKESKVDEQVKDVARAGELAAVQISENLQAKLVQSIRSVFSGKEGDGLKADRYAKEHMPDLMEEPYMEQASDYEEVQDLEPENLTSPKVKAPTPQISMEEVDKVENPLGKEEEESIEEASQEELEELLKETAGNLAGEVASGDYRVTTLTEEERLAEAQRIAKKEREEKAEAELKKQEAAKLAALAALEKDKLTKALGLTREFNFDKEVKELKAQEEAKRLQEAKEASEGLLSAVSLAEAAMEETDKQKDAAVKALKKESFVLPEDIQREIEENRLKRKEKEKELKIEEDLDPFAFVEKLEARKAKDLKEAKEKEEDKASVEEADQESLSSVDEQEENPVKDVDFDIVIDESIVDEVLEEAKKESEKEINSKEAQKEEETSKEVKNPSEITEEALKEQEKETDKAEEIKAEYVEESLEAVKEDSKEDKQKVPKKETTEEEVREIPKETCQGECSKGEEGKEDDAQEAAEEEAEEEVSEEALEEEFSKGDGENPSAQEEQKEPAREDEAEAEKEQAVRAAPADIIWDELEEMTETEEEVDDEKMFAGILKKVKSWFKEKEISQKSLTESPSKEDTEEISIKDIEVLAEDRDAEKAEPMEEELAAAFEAAEAEEETGEEKDLDILSEKLGLEAMKLEIQEMASEKVLETDGEEEMTELLEEPEEYLEDLPPVEARKLSQEEKRIFTYFARIPGLDMQITEALEYMHRGAYIKTSKQGNVVIIGRHGSGKTKLARDLVKAACLDLRLPAAKVAFLDASDLNEKDPATIVGKLAGGFLVIERASYMHSQTVEKLTRAMSFRTDSLKVILEDEKYNIRNLMQGNPEFAKFFDYSITIPVFTNDELVSFAKTYVKEEGYRMEERGVLALYRLIGENQNENEPMTVGDVKAFVDRAISRANRAGRRLERRISKRHLDGENRIYLYEKDFDK